MLHFCYLRILSAVWLMVLRLPTLWVIWQREISGSQKKWLTLCLFSRCNYSHATREGKCGFPCKSTNNGDTSTEMSPLSSHPVHHTDGRLYDCRKTSFLSQHHYLFSTLSASLDVPFTSLRLPLYKTLSVLSNTPSTTTKKSYEGTVRRCHLQVRKRPFTRTWPRCCFGLGPPASRTEQKELSVVGIPSLCYFVVAAQAD